MEEALLVGAHAPYPQSSPRRARARLTRSACAGCPPRSLTARFNSKTGKQSWEHPGADGAAGSSAGGTAAAPPAHAPAAQAAAGDKRKAPETASAADGSPPARARAPPLRSAPAASARARARPSAQCGTIGAALSRRSRLGHARARSSQQGCAQGRARRRVNRRGGTALPRQNGSGACSRPRGRGWACFAVGVHYIIGAGAHGQGAGKTQEEEGGGGGPAAQACMCSMCTRERVYAP